MEPNDNSSRKFTSEEINDILRRALEKQGSTHGVTYQDLVDTARELGIDTTALNEAISEQDRRGTAEQARNAWLSRNRRSFFQHLATYIIVCGALLMMGLVIEDGFYTLFKLTAVWWGVGLAFKAKGTFFPDQRKVERGTYKMLMKHKAREIATQAASLKNKKRFTVDTAAKKFIIENGTKRIEIG